MVFFCLYSCLIARNLLSGMKSCWEVYQYMNHSVSKMSCQAGDAANSLVEGYSKVRFNGTLVSSCYVSLWIERTLLP